MLALGFQQQKGKEDHRRQKTDLIEFKDSFFGAANLKSAFASADFEFYDVILNTKGAQFYKMFIRRNVI